MISPDNITNYNRTIEEAEEFLLFSIMVAGKNAKTTAKKLDSFLNLKKIFGMEGMSPFQFIKYLSKGNLLDLAIRNAKLGQYNRIKKAFEKIIELENLQNVSIEDLESVNGIGPKTARFFVLHSQKNVSLAVLDTHILSWLRDHGVDAPKSTPSGKKYFELEKRFLTYAKEYEIKPAELDLQIWKSYSNKSKTKQTK
jgi:hypothetical protein